MINTQKIYVLLLLWASSFSLAADSVIPEDIYIQTNYDFIEKGAIALSCTNTQQKELLNKYEKILFCKENNLCIKTNKKDICYKAEADEIQSYSFLGQIPSKNIVIIRYEGEEEFFDYFISLTSGKKILKLPETYDGFLQTRTSPRQDFMLVITTNNGYSGNAYLTDIDVYNLTEDLNNKLCKVISVTIKEKTEGPHTYKTLWLNDNTVKIQGIKNSNDYIILSLIGKKWIVKDKNYKSWEDHDPLEEL